MVSANWISTHPCRHAFKVQNTDVHGCTPCLSNWPYQLAKNWNRFWRSNFETLFAQIFSVPFKRSQRLRSRIQVRADSVKKKNYDPYLFVCLIRYFSLMFIRLGASVFMFPFTKNYFYGLTEFQISICECSELQLGDWVIWFAYPPHSPLKIRRAVPFFLPEYLKSCL